MRLLRVYFLLIFLGLPSLTMGAISLPQKKVLVLIGYADEFSTNRITNLTGSNHYSHIALKSELLITQLLQNSGLIQKTLGEFENPDRSLSIKIINSNVLCEGETPGEINFRRTLCDKQKNLSDSILKFIESGGLRKYDELIYLGHARQGLGIGVGPFVPEYTLPLIFYNKLELGHLKKITLAGCETKKLYSHLNNTVEFVGTDEKLMWLSELLPLVLNELKLLLSSK